MSVTLCVSSRELPFEQLILQARFSTLSLPAPVDVQVTGNNLAENGQIAQNLQKEIAGLPGAVDVFIRHAWTTPRWTRMSIGFSPVKPG